MPDPINGNKNHFVVENVGPPLLETTNDSRIRKIGKGYLSQFQHTSAGQCSDISATTIKSSSMEPINFNMLRNNPGKFDILFIDTKEKFLNQVEAESMLNGNVAISNNKNIGIIDKENGKIFLHHSFKDEDLLKYNFPADLEILFIDDEAWTSFWEAANEHIQSKKEDNGEVEKVKKEDVQSSDSKPIFSDKIPDHERRATTVLASAKTVKETQQYLKNQEAQNQLTQLKNEKDSFPAYNPFL